MNENNNIENSNVPENNSATNSSVVPENNVVTTQSSVVTQNNVTSQSNVAPTNETVIEPVSNLDENKKNKNVYMWILIGIALLVIVVLMCLFVLPTFKNNNLEPSNTDTVEVYDLKYFGSKGLKKVVFNHNCYIVCETEYEYELSTSDSKIMNSVLKILSNNIVKEESTPEGLGGPMEIYTIEFSYDESNYTLRYISGINYFMVYKGEKNLPIVTWSVKTSTIEEIENVLSNTDKKVIKGENANTQN